MLNKESLLLSSGSPTLFTFTIKCGTYTSRYTTGGENPSSRRTDYIGWYPSHCGSLVKSSIPNIIGHCYQRTLSYGSGGNDSYFYFSLWLNALPPGYTEGTNAIVERLDNQKKISIRFYLSESFDVKYENFVSPSDVNKEVSFKVYLPE